MKMSFDREELWVHMYNLPLAFMIKEKGEKLENTVGKVMDIDVKGDGSGWGSYLRVLIEMDLTRPLVGEELSQLKVEACGFHSGMKSCHFYVFHVVGSYMALMVVLRRS